MSTDDDPELRDLIAKCLENNGVLGKIRAQLRANTFLALEQQEDPKISFPINNDTVRQYTSTQDGALAMSLVRELLSFFNMQFTLSVFDPESCEGISYNHSSRTALAAQLGLDSASHEEPILQTLLKRILSKGCNGTGEPSVTNGLPEKSNNIPKGMAVNGDDYDEDFMSSSSTTSAANNNNKEPGIVNQGSVEEDLDVSASDLLVSQGSNAENETFDQSTSNSSLANADYVEQLPVKP